MKIHPLVFSLDRRRAAFSLVEVALALGIVGFALVGIVGAIPLAMNNERLSVVQTRAASVASTIFANFRGQPFSTVQYLDDPSATLNLNTLVTDPTAGTPVATFYAAFDEVIAATTTGSELHFYSMTPATAPYYRVTLRFNNHPAGTLTPYLANPNTTVVHAQANAVEVSICESDRPKDVFVFTSVIANRTE